MGHTPGSINEGCMSLNVEDSERDRVQEESTKLYQQATADAAFLRNLSVKQESTAEMVYPFSFDTRPFRSRSVGHQEYAMYRQKYLVMYSPLRTKKGDKKSMKEKLKCKCFTVNLKKQNTKTNTEPKSKDKSSSSYGFLEIVFRFFRFRGANTNSYDANQVMKNSSVSPVS